MLRKKHSYILVVSALFVLLSMLLLPCAVVGGRLPMRHYTSDEGLVNNEVITAFQDSRGYLWFGTYAGLSRFDGKNFKNFDKDGPGITVIRAITEDRSHRIWVGYTGGIVRLNQDTEEDRFTRYTHDDGLLGRDIVGLQPDPKGGIWILTEQGVNYFDGENFITSPLEGIDASLSGTYLQSAPDGGVFVVARGNLFHVLHERAELTIQQVAQVTFPVQSMQYQPQEKALYLISTSELYRYRDGQYLKVASSPLKDDLLNLTIGKDGTLWVISETMLWQRTPRGDKVYSNAMLHEKSLSNLLEDREGNLWLTTWSGISMVIDTKIVNFPELPLKIISAIVKDPDGNLWVGGDQGLVKLSPEHEVLFHNKSAFVEFIYYDDGKIFSSTDSGGLQIYDLLGNLLATHTPDEIYTCMLKDSREKYWLGSYNGLFSLAGQKIVPEIDTKGGLGSNTVWMLLEDEQHHFWVGTENGLSRFTDGQWTHFDTTNGLTHPSIWHLHEHSELGLLAATGKGICRQQQDGFVSLPALSDISIDNLASDPQGKLWVGAPQGVYRIAPDGTLDLVLNKARGLPVSSTYFRTALVDSSYLYIGTHKGLSRIDLDIQNTKTSEPLLYIDKVYINKKPWSTLPAVLQYFEKNLTFFFQAVYMYMPDTVSYTFMLEGMDETWSEKTDLTQAVYTNLSPGKYTFKVQAYAANGTKSGVQSLEFIIAKAFWQTGFFIFTEGLLGLCLVVVVAHFVGERKVRRQQAYAKHLEKQVAERTQTLAEARKAADAANQAKSVFLASMSHEIRTPMNSVVGMSDVLLHSELSEEQRSHIQTVRRSADALLRIIDDILDFSRIEADVIELKNDPFDFMHLMEELGQLLSTPAAEKNIDLIVRYAPDVPKYFRGDAGRIRQVLLNLVGNAVKFTEQGYILIDIHCNKMQRDKAYIHVGVEDTGMGIPEKYLGTIFDRFTQTDTGARRKYGGTGLGLAISSQLVARMGGEIKVTSSPGSGSTFSFILPLTLVKPRTKAYTPGELFSKMRILVVDDNRVSREVWVERLASWRVSCKEAATVEEALEKITQVVDEKGLFDIVFVKDNQMGISGLELGRRIKAQNAFDKTVLIMLSRVGCKPDKKALDESGISACLYTPVRSGQLFTILQEIFSSTRNRLASPFICEDSLTEANEPPLHFNARVLLVEDLITNQMVALAMLHGFGCKVDIANNGEEAVKHVQDKSYDLVLMDCNLPEMDGFEATHLIRQNELRQQEQVGMDSRRHLPIVAMTANASESDRQKCLAAGMDEHMAKPISRTRLLELLEKYIQYSDKYAASRMQKILIAVESFRDSQRIEQTVKSQYPDAVITLASSGIETCTLLAGYLPDLVIVEDTIAGIDPFAMLDFLNGHERYSSIHIIFLANMDYDAETLQGIQANTGTAVLHGPLNEAMLTRTLEGIVSGRRQERESSFEVSRMVSLDALKQKNVKNDEPVLNRDQLLRTFQSDIEMIKGYIDVFLKDMPDIIKELEVAVETGRMDVVENQAHKVKNMAGEAGGMRLYLFASSLEKSAVAEESHFCKTQLPKLKNEFDLLADAIREQGW